MNTPEGFFASPFVSAEGPDFGGGSSTWKIKAPASSKPMSTHAAVKTLDPSRDVCDNHRPRNSNEETKWNFGTKSKNTLVSDDSGLAQTAKAPSPAIDGMD